MKECPQCGGKMRLLKNLDNINLYSKCGVCGYELPMRTQYDYNRRFGKT